MIKVLFVCLGNICRSPLAEGILKQRVKEEGLENKIYVESAGTSGWHIGEPPDPRSMDVAMKNGFRLNSLGRKAIAEDFETFDYIIAMDKSNYTDLQRIGRTAGDDAATLYLMRDFDDIGRGKDVPDPYYGGNDGFDRVYEMLDRSCRNLLIEIKEKYSIT